MIVVCMRDKDMIDLAIYYRDKIRQRGRAVLIRVCANIQNNPGAVNAEVMAACAYVVGVAE